MRILPLIVAFCAGCASAPAPVADVPPPAEYPVPLLKADGSIDTIIVEDDGKQGARVIFCKEQQTYLACLVDENGQAAWATVPFAPDPKSQT